MKGRYLALTAFLALSVWATAHEFWLQPAFFFGKPGAIVPVKILVGEGFTGEPSEGKKNRILTYRHYSVADSTDLKPKLVGETYGEVSVKLTQPGTHLLVFANTPKYIELDARKFLAYLKEDGLDNVIATRQQQGHINKPGRELYRRCAKSLIQVGDQPDDTYARPTDLTLDIVPATNPYLLRTGQAAEFRIMFEDKPLPGALVRYWTKSTPTSKATEEKQRSDANGRVRFTLKPGANMVSVVRMVPAKTPDLELGPADWESYWGSLTFGVSREGK